MIWPTAICICVQGQIRVETRTFNKGVTLQKRLQTTAPPRPIAENDIGIFIYSQTNMFTVMWAIETNSQPIGQVW